jgi:sigma-B regulation protein RsbU (phosphoserine phosphatase)
MDEHRLRRLQKLTLLALTLLVIGVHLSAESAIMREVRTLLSGIAISVGAGLEALPGFDEHFDTLDSLLDITDPGDPSVAFHRHLEEHLTGVRNALHNQISTATMVPRIAHIRVVRRVTPADGAEQPVIPRGVDGEELRDTWVLVASTDWYGLEAEPRVIEEVAAAPGTNWPEVAESDFTEMGLEGGVAERGFHTDELGTWLSAHAPLRGENGDVLGLLTVDMSRAELSETLLQVRLVSAGAWLVLACLITVAFHAHRSRHRAFESMERLDRQLVHQNEELVDKNQRLEEANDEFAKQLTLAQRVQQNFLATEYPRSDKMAFGTVYLACEAVGGDIYDVFLIDNDHMGFYIADVSGHGISAALIGATLKMSVEAMKTAVGSQGPYRRASILYRPRDMVIRLHKILRENLPREQFITMQYGIISTATGSVRLCNAGHTWPVKWNAATGLAEMVPIASGLPIGFVIEEMLREEEIPMAPGDKVIFYTDGLIESHPGNPDVMYGEHRLVEGINLHGAEGAESLVTAIQRDVSAFVGAHPSPDDVAIIVAEMRPEPQEMAEAS